MNPDPGARPPDSIHSGAGIWLDKVSAGYRGGPDVLTDLSLTVAPGAALVVTGGPGAGKSALLNLIRGALAPRAGLATVLGVNLCEVTRGQREDLRRRIGYLAQDPILVAGDSVVSNVIGAASLFPGGAPVGASMLQNAHELLAFLGLPMLGARDAGAVSPAERRLAALARAVLHEPALLLLDEPMRGLGPEAADRVMRLIGQISRRGGTVVIASQTPELFSSLSPSVRRLTAMRREMVRTGA